MRAEATEASWWAEMSPIVRNTELKRQIQRPFVQRFRRKVDVFGVTVCDQHHCDLGAAHPGLKNQGCLPSYLSAGNRKGTSIVPSNTFMDGTSSCLRP